MDCFEISEGIKIIDLFLYIEEYNTLILGDTHIGYEDNLIREGVLIPKFQFEEMNERIVRVLERCKPERIVVVGDVKHDFGRISKQEWNDTSKLMDTLKRHGEVILIKGNHDTMLEPIINKKGLELRDTYSLGKYFFCHGHEVPEDLNLQSSEIIIMGHEHPAIGLREGERVEYYKCFIKGKYEGKELIVLPSVNEMPEGTNVMQEKLQSPLVKDVDSFEAYVVQDEEVYYFGRIGDLLEE